MSKQRSLKPKTDVNIIPDEPVLTTPIPEGTIPDALPFPEFSDQDLNSEKWDNSPTIKTLFEDSQNVQWPPGLRVHKLKRPSELYSNVNFVVFSATTTYPDLISPNQHLDNIEFYNKFISAVEILLYIGCTQPFPIEYGNAGFSGESKKPWRPWNHIYSCCKIVKGEQSPVYNPSGKYVVRLFWLGAWRKIYVDDYLPINNQDNLLLPSVFLPKLAAPSLEFATDDKQHKGKSKHTASQARKDMVELWPMILCKALLKLASISGKDFDIITSLTGWVGLNVKTEGLSYDELWEIFLGYIRNFQWDEEKKIKPDKKAAVKKTAIPLDFENVPDGERYVLASFNQGITKFLSEVRNIPLEKPPPRPELEFWKTFRYESWAVEQGIIPPDIEKMNIKSLKVIDPFQPHIQDQVHSDFGDKSQKSDKKSQSSKSSKLPTKMQTLHPDPSSWHDYNDFWQDIQKLTIYFETRTFKDKHLVSDMIYNKSSGFHYQIFPIQLKPTRNEPLYIFLDSIDSKFMLINLSQVGDTSVLEKIKNEDGFYEETENKSMELEICEEIIKRKTKKGFITSIVNVEDEITPGWSSNNRMISLVLEEYCWISNCIGKQQTVLSTTASKSKVIQSFGRPEYLECLRNFYNCYKLKTNLSKTELICLHRLYFQEICRLIRSIDTLPDTALQAVKLLFLQFQTYDYINPYVEQPHLCVNQFEIPDHVEYAKIMERAAVKLQAHFKGFYIRSMKRKHTEGNPDYFKIFDTLKAVYNDVFAAHNRLQYCPVLIRRVLENKEIEEFANKLEIHSDLISVMNLNEFKGSYLSMKSSWAYLCRENFSILSQDPVAVKIDLFSNLKSYIVRVFNNDTCQEVKSMMNNVIVEKYSKNNLGYTVLCYGWSEEATKISWKLIIASQTMSKSVISLDGTMSSIISNSDLYIPNYKKIISRYAIKVAKNTFITANLTTSFDDVQISMKLLSKDGKILQETRGVKSATIPLIHLLNGQESLIISPSSKKHFMQSATSDILSSKTSAKKSNSKSKGHGLDSSRKKKSSIDTASYHAISELSLKSGLDIDAKLMRRSQQKSHRSLQMKAKSISLREDIGKRGIATTTYYLEATVLNDTWPLTAEEWGRVQIQREKEYLNLVHRSNTSVYYRKSTALDEPRWMLDVIYNSDSLIQIDPDDSASLRRREMKFQWFVDIERYKKAMLLRDKYINENSIDRNQIDLSKRTNDYKEISTRIFVDDSIDEYLNYEEVDKDFCKTKSIDDEIIEEALIERTIKEYERDEQASNDEIECLIQDQLDTALIADDWFRDIKSDSADMINNVLASKQAYIEKMSTKTSTPKTKKTKK